MPMQNFIYHLLQIENRHEKRFIENRRETNVETPDVTCLLLLDLQAILYTL